MSKMLCKILLPLFIVTLLSGCSGNTKNNTAVNNSNTKSETITQTTNTPKEEAKQPTEEVKLPEGVTNKDFYLQTKKIVNLINDLFKADKLIDEKDDTLSKYFTKYNNDKSALNDKEKEMYGEVLKLGTYYSQYYDYSKKNLQANKDNMKKLGSQLADTLVKIYNQ